MKTRRKRCCFGIGDRWKRRCKNPASYVSPNSPRLAWCDVHKHAGDVRKTR